MHDVGTPRCFPPRALARTALVLLACVVAGCGGSPKPTRVVAREEELVRQIQDLRFLVERAEKGSLVPTDGLVVAVSERLALELVQLALPRNEVVQDRFRVRLEKADLRFGDRHAMVRLDGSVTWAEWTDLFDADVSLELTVFARIDAAPMEHARGMVAMKVVPVGFELHRLTLGEESPTARRLAEGLAAALTGSLSALSFPISIPVALEPQLRSAGIETGPVRVKPASLPLRAVVKDVAAHGGRLWLSLQVERMEEHR